MRNWQKVQLQWIGVKGVTEELQLWDGFVELCVSVILVKFWNFHSIYVKMFSNSCKPTCACLGFISAPLCFSLSQPFPFLSTLTSLQLLFLARVVPLTDNSVVPRLSAW